MLEAIKSITPEPVDLDFSIFAFQMTEYARHKYTKSIQSEINSFLRLTGFGFSSDDPILLNRIYNSLITKPTINATNKAVRAPLVFSFSNEGRIKFIATTNKMKDITIWNIQMIKTDNSKSSERFSLLDSIAFHLICKAYVSAICMKNKMDLVNN